MQLKERIERRKKGREEAQSILGLLTIQGDQTAIAAFFEELKDSLCPKQVTETKQVEQRKLKELAAWPMPYGKYGGQPLSEIPLEYLHWLTSDSEETMSKINQYLELTKHA